MPSVVQRSDRSMTGPWTYPTAVHLVPSFACSSSDNCPTYESTVATPLMAPVHSAGELSHTPSTQPPDCTTIILIVRVVKFADSNVPDQLPAMFTAGPGTGAVAYVVGVVVVMLDPQPATVLQRAMKTNRGMVLNRWLLRTWISGTRPVTDVGTGEDQFYRPESAARERGVRDLRRTPARLSKPGVPQYLKRYRNPTEIWRGKL